jgi:glucose-1-phosphate adenylyltransferase
MWVITNCESERYHRIVSRLPPLAERAAESHVAEKGAIKNSWIGSGVEVEGVVEDSIIFPGVVIRRNAVVSRSVVLNGNRIGTGSEIHNTLILPFSAEVPRTSPNIGDNCAIGAKNSVMRNADFPGQIRGGVTLIGTNSDIPNGFHAEAGSYIAPGVSPSVLKRLKVLKKGTSIQDTRPPSAAGENGNGGRTR